MSNYNVALQGYKFKLVLEDKKTTTTTTLQPPLCYRRYLGHHFEGLEIVSIMNVAPWGMRETSGLESL